MDEDQNVSDGGSAVRPHQGDDLLDVRSSLAERAYETEDEQGRASERSTRQIRSEIERTRVDMGETIDAIQDRLKPRNIMSRTAGNVRDATVGKVRQMIRGGNHDDDVARRAADWYYGSGLLDRVRENPIPAVLAAASLAWLALGKRPSRDYSGPPTYERRLDPEELYRGHAPLLGMSRALLKFGGGSREILRDVRD